MARKKVNIAWIAKDSTRRATFKKRTVGLMKKVREIATLCDVKACAIVYGPQEPYPEDVWPSVPDAMPVLDLFKSMPEMEQCRKMMNREGFILQQVTKLQEHLRKQERENRELEMTLIMHECLKGTNGSIISLLMHQYLPTIEDTTCLAWMVERNLRLVQQRINNFFLADNNTQQIINASTGDDGGSMIIPAPEQENDINGGVLLPPLDQYHHHHQMALTEVPADPQTQNWTSTFMDVSSTNWQWNHQHQYYPSTINGNVIFGGGEDQFMQPYVLDHYDTNAWPNVFPFN